MRSLFKYSSRAMALKSQHAVRSYSVEKSSPVKLIQLVPVSNNQSSKNQKKKQIATMLGFHTSTSHASSGKANMTTLVVGLGNHSMPGTRHSVGMAIADQFCRHFDLNWSKDRECQGLIATTTVEERSLIFLKPRLLMNINGRSVLKTVVKYDIPISNVFLLHDDLDRPLGKYSIKDGGSAGGHNGVKSAINSLGTNKMLRLRFGIDRPTNQSAVPDYVLEKFSSSEKELLPKLLDECVQVVLKKIQESTIK